MYPSFPPLHVNMCKDDIYIGFFPLVSTMLSEADLEERHQLWASLLFRPYIIPLRANGPTPVSGYASG
jgi:hypothetical protein